MKVIHFLAHWLSNWAIL
jgi:hypothetical protein